MHSNSLPRDGSKYVTTVNTGMFLILVSLPVAHVPYWWFHTTNKYEIKKQISNKPHFSMTQYIQQNLIIPVAATGSSWFCKTGYQRQDWYRSFVPRTHCLQTGGHGGCQTTSATFKGPVLALKIACHPSTLLVKLTKYTIETRTSTARWHRVCV